MTTLVSRHLADSTLFCLLMGGLACCLKRQRAATRHSLWLMGIGKFAVPTALLTETGARMAFLVPASTGMALLAAKFSAILSAVFGWLPANLDSKDATATSIGFLVVWIAGATTMVTTWAARWCGRYRGLEAASEAEHEALSRVKRRLGMREPIRLLRSGRDREPSLLGIRRPTITFPRGLVSELSVSEFEAVLLHELAHARRRDNLTGAFVHILVCLFWFHPLLWLAEKRVLAERERACDEMVVRSGTAPEIYVAGILKVCRFQIFDHLGGVSAMTGSDLKNRLELILGLPLCKSVSRAGRFALAAAGLLMTFLPVAGGYCQQCVSNGGPQVVPRPCSPASRATSGHQQQITKNQHSCSE